MFDTVNFWIERENIPEGNTFGIAPLLSDITDRNSDERGYSMSGKLDNYAVNIYPNGISLKGSLAKYYFGDNLHTLQRGDVIRAIEKMRDALHFDVSTAKVTRLDISTIIPTKRPPADLYNFFGAKRYFTRLQSTADTLYYNNHQRQIVLYDKIKEATAKGVTIPDVLQGGNWLRYELRYTQRLNKQLSGVVTAQRLYDVEFYRSVIQNWKNEFMSISKIKTPSFMIENINTLKDAETALFAHLLQKDGQHIVDDYLATLKSNNVFTARQRYSDLKRKLNQILQAPKGEQTDFIKELETRICEIAKYAR